MTAKYHKKTVALFPGSFNPFTIGHMDILKRGLDIFDSIVIAVGYNTAKMSQEDLNLRVRAIEKAVEGLENVSVTSYSSLTVDEAKKVGASVILRGIRSVADFEYERSMAEANKKIGGIETVILTSSPEFSYISSSFVRELEEFGYNVDKFLP